MSHRTTILIPASGKGERFRESFKVPKPLVRFSYRGGPSRMMLEHAMDGTVDYPKYVAVSENIRDFSFTQDHLVSQTTFIVTGETSGQADTVFKLAQRFKVTVDGPVMVLNADGMLLGVPYCFDNFMQENYEFEAGVVVIESDDLSLSYVENEGPFRHAREKCHLSRFAIAGAFWFRDMSVLHTALNYLMFSALRGPNGEPYMSDALNFVPGWKYAYKIPKELWVDFGTPDALYNNPDIKVEAADARVQGS